MGASACPEALSEDTSEDMPHGDFSDVSAYTCAALGSLFVLAPWVCFESAGPIQPMFAGEVATPATLAAIRFAGGLLMFMAPVLYVVRWNVLNGKAGALGCAIASANMVSIALALDGNTFVLRGWYVFAIFLLLAAVHLAFNANPMLTSAMLLEKEKAKAAKKAAKAK